MFSRIRRLMSNLLAAQTFDSNTAIQMHLDQRSRIENYVAGKSKKLNKVPLICNADCMVGKWLHGDGGSQFKDTRLINSLCSSCEEFHEAASQAVLLADMGETEMAKTALQLGHVYANASAELQQHLERLQQRLLELQH